ncbi:sensor histidine kinase [Sulfurospirillum barnesii]|uniref:histidine kinase n=1 Tax=Sulfurospirillum barnesii (strain ATCC 700032 / DSM 10660 / SES-3) TaxID=760154 RepID=I3XVY8_SULBS|nr:HAMP domain-containing sensor histidine kinase [Sulfurospirillum barnesii]AFL68112.1 histidine kinase [Sulfurospirillum barnesii SES-3]
MRHYAFFYAFYLFLFFSHTLMAQEEKRVLIIDSYPKNFKWSNDIILGIKDVLAKSDMDADVIYMSGKAAKSKEDYTTLRNLLEIKLKHTHYDLIIPVDKHAYTFLLHHYYDFFVNERILFSSMEFFSYEDALKQGLANKISGVIKERAIEDNVNIILTMIPSLKKLYILNEKNPEDKTNISIKNTLDAMRLNCEVEYIGDLSLQEMREKFSIFTPDETILFIPFYGGNYDQFYKNYKIAYTIDLFEIPVFATDSFFITRGIVGGKSILTYKLGETTGNLARDILRNPTASNKIITDKNHEYIFNHEKINKFKLEPFLLTQSLRFVNTPVRFLDKHKKYVDAILLILPLLILLILALIHNIYMRIKDEKKYRESELQKNKHQQFIIQQSKLAEIGDIFSSIAHQWKNPLVEITALVQKHAFSVGSAFDEKNDKYIHDIMVQVRYMTDTINSFQAFIMPSTTKTVFDVNEAIETMMGIISHTIKYNYIDVTIDISHATNLSVLGYKNEFMQTLLNIVNNAKEQIVHQREAKKIKRGLIAIVVYNHAHTVIIEISDNAGGIPEEKLPYIFDAYYTTKEHGHGIGLYMSKIILENKMNGTIKADNTPMGARFSITLGNVV